MPEYHVLDEDEGNKLIKDGQTPDNTQFFGDLVPENYAISMDDDAINQSSVSWIIKAVHKQKVITEGKPVHRYIKLNEPSGTKTIDQSWMFSLLNLLKQPNSHKKEVIACLNKQAY